MKSRPGIHGRAAAVVGAVALIAVSVVASATGALAETSEVAPPGEAEAVAAEVEGVLAIGHSKAQTGADGGGATGNAIEVGGEPPASQFGGTQNGEGTSSGALLDTGSTPVGQVQVTPWSAEVSQSGATTTATGAAALLRLVLGDNIAALAVLQSQSQATHNGSSSTGQSSSDGLWLNVGGESGLTVVVLHAETTSSGEGGSYLVGIQDEKLFTSEDAGGQCRLQIPSVLGLVCLSASGGEVSTPDRVGTPASASVADVAVGGDGDLAGRIVAAKGSGAQSGAAVLSGVDEPRVTAQAGPSSPARGVLAFTGGSLGASTVAGLSLLMAGLAIHMVRRRVRPAPPAA